MSDFFSGLFGGGGGDTTGGGGGGFFGNLFGGGGDGSSPFDLSSIMGGDSGGGLASLFGGNNGMGSYDPATQTPTPAQTQQGGDPGGQLAGSRPDQAQPGQGGGQQQKRDPFTDFGRILSDALSGKFQQPGYNNLTGVASQALPQQPGYGDNAGSRLPGQPSMDAGPASPSGPQPPGAQPGQPPQQAQGPTDAQGIPRGPTASVPKGITPGERTPTSLDPFTDPRQPTAPADQPKVPDKVVDGGAQPPTGGAPTGGQPGGQGQNQFGQFMRSPLGMIVQALIGQALGRMGPQGAMIAQLLSPALSQLAGQGGFGTGMRGPFPDYGGRMPASLPPNAGGQPGAGPGSPHDTAGGPAGRTGNAFTDQLVHIESNGKNIVSQVDKDDSGRTLAQGGNPNQISQGYFQIRPSTWRIYAARAGVNPNIQPRQASFEDQRKVAQQIPIGQWGPNTKRLLTSQFGAFNPRMTFGQVEAMHGGTQVAQGGLPPRIQPMPSPFDLNRRRRQRMSMGWQF